MDFETYSASYILQWAIQTFQKRFAVVTSFQAEGMVIVDMAVKLDPSVRVISIDTGRLPAETYQIMETVRSRYGIEIEIVTPDSAELSSMLTQHGPNLFYREPAFRNLCCEVRKVRPLKKKLTSVDAYAAGLRREQAESRQNVARVDRSRTPMKISPLADWTKTQVWDYIREHEVPVHPLYQQGYQSIGCAPCTRATEAGEEERAGRWWWEQDAVKECGLHFTPDGKMRRKFDVLLEEVVAQ